MVNKDEIIRKVNSLIALIEHSETNDNEREVAKTILAKIMKKYKLEPKDVVQKGPCSECPEGLDSFSFFSFSKSDAEFSLFSELCLGFGCRPSVIISSKDAKRVFIVFGDIHSKTKIEYFHKYIYELSLANCNFLMDEKVPIWDADNFKENYIYGVALGIKENISNFKEYPGFKDSETTDLTVIPPLNLTENIIENMEEKNLEIPECNSLAFTEGYTFGKRFSFFSPLENTHTLNLDHREV